MDKSLCLLLQSVTSITQLICRIHLLGYFFSDFVQILFLLRSFFSFYIQLVSSDKKTKTIEYTRAETIHF